MSNQQANPSISKQFVFEVFPLAEYRVHKMCKSEETRIADKNSGKKKNVSGMVIKPICNLISDENSNHWVHSETIRKSGTHTNLVNRFSLLQILRRNLETK